MKELYWWEHAKQRIEERKISIELIKQVIESPDQIIKEDSSKIFYYSKIPLDLIDFKKIRTNLKIIS